MPAAPSRALPSHAERCLAPPRRSLVLLPVFLFLGGLLHLVHELAVDLLVGLVAVFRVGDAHDATPFGSGSPRRSMSGTSRMRAQFLMSSTPGVIWPFSQRLKVRSVTPSSFAISRWLLRSQPRLRAARSRFSTATPCHAAGRRCGYLDMSDDMSQDMDPWHVSVILS